MTTALIYQRQRQKIGLTALIDVVFILLMFFMLTSTFINARQIEMKTPVANAAEPAQASVPVLALLDVGGVITVNKSRIDDLEPGSLALFEWYVENRPVVLVPDADATVQEIVAALEQLSGAGIAQLTLGNARDDHYGRDKQ